MDELLAKVQAIDTRAGSVFRYITTRALCDKKFARKLSFTVYPPVLLISLFSWWRANEELPDSHKVDWAAISLEIRYHERRFSRNKNSVFSQGDLYA